MIPCFTDEEFKNAKYKDLLKLQCKQCKKFFYRTKHEVYNFLNENLKVEEELPPLISWFDMFMGEKAKIRLGHDIIFKINPSLFYIFSSTKTPSSDDSEEGENAYVSR